jgi:hypothetical protein
MDQYDRRDYKWGYEIWLISAVAPYSQLIERVFYMRW